MIDFTTLKDLYLANREVEELYINGNKVWEKSGDYTKYGVAINNLLGDIDQNGVVQRVASSESFEFSAPEILSVPSSQMQGIFRNSNAIRKLLMPNLRSIDSNGMAEVCQDAHNLSEIDFSSLQRVIDSGLQGAFQGTSIQRAAFPALTTIESYSLNNAFYNCASLEELDLSSLTTVDGYDSMSMICQSCSGLRTVKFGPLASVRDDVFLYLAFQHCQSLETVDFSKATIVPPLYDYTTFEGANATYKILVPNALYETWINTSPWSHPSVKPHIEKAVKALEFKAVQANSTVSMQASGNVPVSLEYSTDGTTWQPFVVGTTTVTLANVGDFVLMRAGENGNTQLGRDYSNYNQFVITGQVEANDDVGFLLSRNGTSSTALPPYCFVKLFGNCTGLTKAPDLPSMNLGAHCYEEMFEACTGLTTAPELPATTLTEGCYHTMFSRSGITSINLPATTLAQQCYEYMFYNCSSLNEIQLGWEGNFSGANVPTNAFSNWVYGVAGSGTMYYYGSDTTQGVSAIPSGWTVLAPDYGGLCLKAVTAGTQVQIRSQNNNAPVVSLEYSTDGHNFSSFGVSQDDGTGGTTVTLANVGDKVWFRATTTNERMGRHWGSQQSNRFHINGQAKASGVVESLLDKNYQNVTNTVDEALCGLFWDCTGLVDAEGLVLNCDSVSGWAYAYMFQGCYNLVGGPSIMGTQFSGSYACEYMFQNCTSLTSIKMPNFNGYFDYSTFQLWVDNVSSSGTFYYNGPDTTHDNYAIPNGWTVQTTTT